MTRMSNLKIQEITIDAVETNGKWCVTITIANSSRMIAKSVYFLPFFRFHSPQVAVIFVLWYYNNNQCVVCTNVYQFLSIFLIFFMSSIGRCGRLTQSHAMHTAQSILDLDAVDFCIGRHTPEIIFYYFVYTSVATMTKKEEKE